MSLVIFIIMFPGTLLLSGNELEIHINTLSIDEETDEKDALNINTIRVAEEIRNSSN